MDKRYDAVIFDLFGTLVDNVTAAVYHACLRQTADVFGIDGDAFIACWVEDTFRHQRRVGMLPSAAAQMEYVCRAFGVPIVPAQIEQAVMLQRSRFGLGSLTPRAGTLETLATLKGQGYALGLISDCSWEVPDVWQHTAFAPLFDVTIFSCAAGARKPDPRLFRQACENLRVSPSRCLYLGDGDGRELTGARQAGMEAVLICMPHEREMVMQREDPQQWEGTVIEWLCEIEEYLNCSSKH